MNILYRTIIAVLFILITSEALSQNTPPTTLIKYDLKSPVQPEVPFDKPFAIQIDGVLSNDIERIDVFETKYEYQTVELYNDHVHNGEVRDFIAVKDPLSKELIIHFPPIRPNKTFTVRLVKKLAPECRTLLMKLNGELHSGQEDTQSFTKLYDCTVDKATGYSYLYFINETEHKNLSEYKSFFDSNLKTIYDDAVDDKMYQTKVKLTLEHVRALDSATTKYTEAYSECHHLYELIRSSKIDDILLGYRSIQNVYSLDPKTTAEKTDIETRVKNLNENLKFFEDALKRSTRILSRGVDKVKIQTDQQIKNVTDELRTFRDALNTNLNFINTKHKRINEIVDADRRFRQSISIGGGTLSANLKAAGGNVLFLDAGITNIFAKNLQDNISSIPKLYFGVSIYFRPIDKNTRASTFPREKDFNPVRRKGCSGSGVDEYCGPDYGIVANRSIWQHLSLNVGITLGAMQDKDFDNFYNSNSLLIGPSYRFRRAFKVGAGLSLLRRSSKNPLISEKQVIPGAYVSLSVDIDFIQPISNVISILFK